MRIKPTYETSNLKKVRVHAISLYRPPILRKRALLLTVTSPTFPLLYQYFFHIPNCMFAIVFLHNFINFYSNNILHVFELNMWKLYCLFLIMFFCDFVAQHYIVEIVLCYMQLYSMFTISLDKFTLGSHFIISLEWGFCFLLLLFLLILFLFLFCFYLGEAVSCFWLYCLIPRISLPNQGFNLGLGQWIHWTNYGLPILLCFLYYRGCSYPCFL